MLITEREVRIRKSMTADNLLTYIRNRVADELDDDEIAVRFAVVDSAGEYMACEIGVLSHYGEAWGLKGGRSIFEIRPRDGENAGSFNVALVIPTGLGCDVGGHSGDGGAVARLFASTCDRLITHPNVVNAADVNELPENGLYVEGSVLSKLLCGTASLREVRSNRVLLVVDEHRDELFHELAINAASAARASMGMNIPRVVVMRDRIEMHAEFTRSRRAAGRIEGLGALVKALRPLHGEYDAIALSTLIQVPDNYHLDYFEEGSGLDTVNPWGGVEAMLTHAVSMLYGVPSAHSPMMTSSEVLNLDVGVVDPRKAAEAVSMTFLHCVLKGLHRSPRIVDGTMTGPGTISCEDISCLVIPDGCLGIPTLAAAEQNIPVIAVRNQQSRADNDLGWMPNVQFADNYLEAAGMVSAIRAGVSTDSVRRPMPMTQVTFEEGTDA